MLNPAAFDDANLDDYLGADFEGFMKGWGDYHRLHPHSKGPPPVYRPPGQRIPGTSPGNFNPHDFLNPVSDGMGPVNSGEITAWGPEVVSTGEVSNGVSDASELPQERTPTTIIPSGSSTGMDLPSETPSTVVPVYPDFGI